MSFAIELNENVFTDLSVVLNETYVIGSHRDGFFSVMNLEDQTSTIVEQPFGHVDNVWGVEVFSMRAEGEPQILYIPTTNGLYCCMVTEQGQFMYNMESFYEGVNVTNSVIINEDELLCSLETEEWKKLVILNLET